MCHSIREREKRKTRKKKFGIREKATIVKYVNSISFGFKKINSIN
jgi:hypothetical protein